MVQIQQQTTETPVVELTKLEKLKLELANKQAEAKQESMDRIETIRLESTLSLLDNEEYVDALTKREFREENIKTLTGLVASMNNIAPVKLPGEGNINVNCYPINDRLFGTEIGLLLGIIQTASSAYVQEHKDIIIPMIKVPLSLIEDMQVAFGTTAYWSKRTFSKFDEIPGNYEEAKALLQEIASVMNLKPLDISKFTKSAYELHFNQAKMRANTKLKEYEITLAVDASSEFTLTTTPTAE